MIINPEVEAYISKLSPLPHPVLAEMEEYATEIDFPIVGPLVGRLLIAMIRFGHVHTVLDCGSGFGYSALWMALALPENGKITCIDSNEERNRQAINYLKAAEMSHKVNIITGKAEEVVPTLKNTYDLILNDVDKDGYPQILPHLLDRLRVGGMLMTDNVLWSGKVVDSTPDKNHRSRSAI